MFGAMKHLLKEKPAPAGDAVRLADLHEGCVVGFGFMPQKNISGRRIPLTQVNSYLFDDDSFLAYRLQDDGIDMNLIVADGDDQAHRYLALSQPVEPRLFRSLFVSPLPHDWFGMQEGETIDAAPRVLGLAQGWFAARYTLAMTARGYLLEGDFRLRKAADRVKLARAFDYVLLVDDANNHALEGERYDDGEIRIYATVYRPVTDIGEMSRPHRVQNLLQPLPELSLESISEAIPMPVISEEPHALVTLAEPAPLHGKFGRIQPVEAPLYMEPRQETLACETRLAGRIIDEAERNQMPLTELIRKVIDLPARIQEEVLIPFALEDTEYAELARRYNLPAADREAIRQQILEELKQFVGLG